MADPVVEESVNNTLVFSFEKNFDEDAFLKYMKERWTDSFMYSALYVMVVFGGQKYMRNRQRYDLRPALALWSGFLAVFSIIGTIRTLPELVSTIENYSWVHSICVPSFFKNVPAGYWSSLFIVSKVYELGDTVFIVLRKQQLIFLHWYHHITVLIYCWYSYTEHTAPGRWFMVMNYIVHSLMYSYYALRALKFNIPKWVNMVITSLQLAQMIIGVSINVVVYWIKGHGGSCQQSYENLHCSSIMYFTYFVLFAQFFYSTYIVKKPKVDNVPQKSEERDKKHA
ncbi:very long chain fatty acid elongase 6-like [Babylonia areolata]|uniref:very long chain fatty acid elongase 6-like n=1 Tax=Babylonia areolata TaxID=304850 RepID=UPI003FD638F1